MTTKVEEVARAIAGSTWDTCSDRMKEGLRHSAREAIKAMRTPTMEMEIGGKAALIVGRSVHGNDVCPSPCACYAAMIDAALAEDKG